MTAAAVMRPSHRAARVTVAPAAALTSLSREIHDMLHGTTCRCFVSRSTTTQIAS